MLREVIPSPQGRLLVAPDYPWTTAFPKRRADRGEGIEGLIGIVAPTPPCVRVFDHGAARIPDRRGRVRAPRTNEG
jgi:hypothetical protein